MVRNYRIQYKTDTVSVILYEYHVVKAISDLEEMQLKSLYEAEIVSNRLFNNETAFRDNIIQVRLIILRILS